MPLLRYYHVFNVAQCEGLPEKTQAEAAPFNPIQEAEQIIQQMPNRPHVQHNKVQAAYNPATDIVNMPSQKLFHNHEEYYSTLFHELVHATGHHTRLHRFQKKQPGRFGSDTYSREELVAEMGAAFLCSTSGIANKTMTNAAAYIKGWLHQLKDDKRLVTLAAAKAQKAADFILDKPANVQEKPLDSQRKPTRNTRTPEKNPDRRVVERHPDAL